ncbi:MAG: invasion associated locus B family protein [Boseongicola sp.]
MVNVAKFWVLLIAISLPAALFAQEQPTSEEVPTETEVEATDDGEQQAQSDLAIGTEAGPRVGETYDRQKIKDWLIRCVKTETGDEQCRLHQLLRDAQGTPVAEINFFSVPETGQIAAGASVVTPLETLLTQQIRLSVDGGSARVYPFRFCSQIGCISRMGFTADEVAEFKRGAAAQILIVPAGAPEAEVVLEISLAGFTAGFDALGELAE